MKTDIVKITALLAILAATTALPIAYYFNSPVGMFAAFFFGALFACSIILKA